MTTRVNVHTYPEAPEVRVVVAAVAGGLEADPAEVLVGYLEVDLAEDLEVTYVEDLRVAPSVVEVGTSLGVDQAEDLKVR